MDAVISGITAMDRMELESELAAYGIEFKEDDSAQHGEGDMGIFTIGVPLTIAVTKVIKAWIERRPPINEVIIKKGTQEVKVKSAKKISPAEFKEYCEAIDKLSE